jgi:hypothetical protein
MERVAAQVWLVQELERGRARVARNTVLGALIWLAALGGAFWLSHWGGWLAFLLFTLLQLPTLGVRHFGHRRQFADRILRAQIGSIQPVAFQIGKHQVWVMWSDALAWPLMLAPDSRAQLLLAGAREASVDERVALDAWADMRSKLGMIAEVHARGAKVTSSFGERFLSLQGKLEAWGPWEPLPTRLMECLSEYHVALLAAVNLGDVPISAGIARDFSKSLEEREAALALLLQ